MPTRVQCPSPDCLASYSVSDEHIGRAGRCPKCGRRFTFSSTIGGEPPPIWPESDDRPSTLAPDSMFGRYRIVRLLGRGGMGAVYLAYDTDLHRSVALKVPHFSIDESPEIIHRFRREARAAAGFDHPNLCPVFDVGQINGKHFLTMPYLEGRDISCLLDHGPLSEQKAAKVVRMLALALQRAHEKGVIHRDLKPSNIMVSPNRGLVVMDFGLARRSLADDSLHTQAGTLLGTPAYMAPEQVDGDPEAIGPATDIYALGVMMYQLLTNRLPFLGSTTSVLVQIKTAQPAPPSTIRPGLDRRLEAICMKALAKNPRQRFGSMAELASALDPSLQTKPPKPAAAGRPRTPGRKTALAIAAAALLVLVVLGVVIRFVTDRGEVRIAIADPASVGVVLVDGHRIELEALGEPLTMRVGEHELEVTRRDFTVQTKRFEVRRGNGNPAVTVEYTPVAFNDPGHVAPTEEDATVERPQPDPDPSRAKPEPSTSWRTLVENGDAAFRRREFQAALADFDAALQQTPDDRAAVLGRRGQTLWRLNRTAEALAVLDEALRLNPQNAQALATRGWIQQHLSRFDLGRNLAEQALKVEPDLPIALALRGRILAWNQRDYEAARADIEAALALDPECREALLARSAVHHLQGEYDQAIADCNRAIDRDPQDAIAYHYRGDAYRDRGDNAAAFIDFNRALAIHPEDSSTYACRGGLHYDRGNLDAALADCNSAIQHGPIDSRAYSQRGKIHQDRGESDQAIADYTRAIDLDPNVAVNYTNRASVHYNMGDLDAAFADCTRAIALDPENGLAYSQRGDIYYDREEYDLAFANYTRAIDLNWVNDRVFNQRGNIHYTRGDYDRAIADYTRAIGYSPNDVVIYSNRAGAHYSNGDSDAAFADCTSALEIDPNYSRAQGQRGHIHFDRGKPDQAMADYTRAIELGLEDTRVFNQRGNIYYDREDYDRAIADYTRAIACNPIDDVLYSNRGNAEYNKGNFDAAIADFTLALERNPTRAKYYQSRGSAYEQKGDEARARADRAEAARLEADSSGKVIPSAS